jgi:hypothetical protein
MFRLTQITPYDDPVAMQEWKALEAIIETSDCPEL